MRVTVTQEHIDSGYRCDCRNCPIAYAIYEALGNLKHQVEVKTYYVNIDYPVFGIIESYHLPYEAIRFIDLYDHESPVEPFQFELKL